MLENCIVCPRKCGINRDKIAGYCKASNQLKINLTQLHFGEEPVFSGINGSGTIFFSHCNLSCVFCQNYKISQLGYGKNITTKNLVEIMIELQSKKAHNINLVTPTHFSLQIIEALQIAKKEGLTIPVIWNSNAYEEVTTLKKLYGLVDIYLPDLKYFDSSNSKKYSGAADYPNKAHAAIKEMFWQVGNIQLKNNLAQRGVMIRLLVLPNNISGIEKTFEWISRNFGTEIYISLMSQYYPTYKADSFNELSKGLTKKEHEFATAQFNNFGFQNGYIQDISCNDEWTPDFVQNAL